MPRYRSAGHCGRGCLAIARHDTKGLSPLAIFLSFRAPFFVIPSPLFCHPERSEGSLGTFVPWDDKKGSMPREDKKGSAPWEDMEGMSPRALFCRPEALAEGSPPFCFFY